MAINMEWMAGKHELEFDFWNKLDLGDINLDISRMYLVYKGFQMEWQGFTINNK